MPSIYLTPPGGEQREYDEVEVRQLWELGLINSGTLYWKDGMDDWKPVEEMFPSQPTAPASPPLPGVPPPPAPNLPGIWAGTYAGFWKRFLAVFIDIFVMAPLGYAGGFIWGMVAVEALEIYDLSVIEAGGNLVGVIVGWTYYSVMESSHKQGTLAAC